MSGLIGIRISFSIYMYTQSHFVDFSVFYVHILAFDVLIAPLRCSSICVRRAYRLHAFSASSTFNRKWVDCLKTAWELHPA